MKYPSPSFPASEGHAHQGKTRRSGMQQGGARRVIEHLIEQLEGKREDDHHQEVQRNRSEMRTLAALQRLLGFYEMDRSKHHPKWGTYVMSPLRHYQTNADRLRELSPGLIEELEAAGERDEPFLVAIEDYGFTQEVVLAMLNIAQIARITLILVPIPATESDATTSALPLPSHVRFSLQDAEGHAKAGSMLEGYRREKPPVNFPADTHS